MEININNYKIDEKTIVKLKIEYNKITGIIGKNNDKLINLLNLNINDINNISINEIKINNKNIDAFKKRIKLVEEELETNLSQLRIKDIMIKEILDNTIKMDDYDKKMKDSLKIVGLPINYIDRQIITLSNYEKKLVLLSVSLLSNPSVLIIKEPFKNLDLNNKRKLIRFYNKIKERYQKTIIYISNDSNMLYENTNNIVLAKNNRVIESTSTDKFFNSISLLKKHKLEIPDSVEFREKVKQKKNKKLTNYKDVRDILKDIYKHV